ncbi:tRNA lysidine(34) synthetase TilS [Enemella evansiae]|uniref:tRNA lysidine(34) synthetase TilS n=1 Tax=Enemella evansiae TaxID=2016499 RepID=UPI001E35881B|nr:tRNA lysidine(34) synthetase TilS [Enemella evansiae]
MRVAKKELGPALLELVGAVEHAIGDREAPLLVGCSGGADSLSLVAATAIVARRRGLPARAVVIDHGLQPDSAEVAAKAASRAGKLGLEADVVAVHVGTDGGPEAAARTARHEALAAVAEETGALVLLGHTLDDQAETVLLGLARGSGARSLRGMAPERDCFVRPFLGVRRKLTEAACAEAGTKYWDDPHNSDDAYARVRIRRKVLPLMEDKLGPGIAESLARTATMLRDDSELLERLSQQAVPDDQLTAELPLTMLPDEPALRRRVLRRWLVERGAEQPAYRQVLAVDSLISDWHGQKWVEVPGLRVARRENRLLVLPD